MTTRKCPLVSKIISGGQEGADRGGLYAGLLLELDTGGTAPKGWRVEGGYDPSLADYGLVQHELSSYPPRTRQNVQDSDGMLVFGDMRSAGSALTLRCCAGEGKPATCVSWRAGEPVPLGQVALFRAWLVAERVRVLNVAGNRESKQPGIHDAVVAFLVAALEVT